ncbi:hypothetical protein CRG98_033371 [Punica granatum]|uniref:Uncharacterized protein n=1 Tax=Punica granatum TaxID=22663 RepID=A0A2I0IQF7_PUNGR|nr:hypothetical protein CRG98_033371 [Punica granatum]
MRSPIAHGPQLDFSQKPKARSVRTLTAPDPEHPQFESRSPSGPQLASHRHLSRSAAPNRLPSSPLFRYFFANRLFLLSGPIQVAAQQPSHSIRPSGNRSARFSRGPTRPSPPPSSAQPAAAHSVQRAVQQRPSPAHSAHRGPAAPPCGPTPSCGPIPFAAQRPRIRPSSPSLAQHPSARPSSPAQLLSSQSALFRPPPIRSNRTVSDLNRD